MINLKQPEGKFEWSESEQVWPNEKTDDGKTIYCKLVKSSTGPSGASTFYNHGISNLDNFWRIDIYLQNPSAKDRRKFNLSNPAGGAWNVDFQITNSTQIFVEAGNTAHAGFHVEFYLWYTKTA